MSSPAVAAASRRRLDTQLAREIELRCDLLLANYQHISPSAMGHLRFLLKHYAKNPHPFRACVTGDTEVETQHGPIAIRDLREGDLVWSYNQDRGFELRPATWVGMTRRSTRVARLTVDGGDRIEATLDHPFLCFNGQWANLGSLRSGDLLLTPSSGASTRARLAVPLASMNSSGDLAGVLGPEMSARAREFASGLDERDVDLFGVVCSDGLGDRGLAAVRHERVEGAHHFASRMPVQAPMPYATMLRVREVDDAAEDHGDSIERGTILLRSGDQQGGGAYSSTATSAAVETEASLALQESGGPGHVSYREVSSVEVLDQRVDVWDIEVGENHCFVAHGLIVHNCVRDNMRRFGPGRTEAICATLKDAIRQTTHWRGHPSIDTPANSPGVEIAEADAKLGEVTIVDAFEREFGVEPPEEVWRIIEQLGESCDVYRVLIGLDEAPRLELAA